MTKTYNGWTNFETWAFMQNEGDDLTELVKELAEMHGGDDFNVRDCVKDYLEVIRENALENVQGFAADAINAAINGINSKDIAETIEDELN